MKHPVVGNRQAVAFFLVVWLLVAGVHFFVLHYVVLLATKRALIDTLVHIGLLLPMALGLWFPIRFAMGAKGLRADWLSLVLSLLLMAAGWVFASWGLLLWLLPHEAYLRFLQSALLFRLAMAVLLFGFITLVYLLISYYQNYQERINEENKLRASFRDVQLSFLQSQINPHFLFNALNGVNSLIMSDPDKAQEMIAELSDMLRYNLKQSHNHFHDLPDEIQNMERYLAIEKIRYGQRLQYEIHYEQTAASARIPALIILPLLENAVKFSLHQSTGKAEINCHLALKNNLLHLSMSNTFDASADDIYGTGTGLKNLAQRLELLYGRGSLMQHEIKGNLFIVKMQIPQYIEQSSANMDLAES